ncbi:MAG: acyltransferase [Eubacteriales bacterium]|nr:acyltransferase [Eubacteriales bacterium]
MEIRNSRERKIYLELLRCIAVLLVIFNHTDGFFLYYTNTDHPVTFVYSLLLSVLCRVNVPVFFMISGALLLERQESVSELFRKRVWRIILVIFLFSFFQYAIDAVRGRETQVSLFSFLKGVATGTIEETYWFLYAYLGILLLLPFMRKLVKQMRREEFVYLLILEILMAVFIPAVGSFVRIQIPSALYFVNVNVFYMIMGYALEHDIIGNGKNVRTWKPVVGMLLFIVISAGVCCLRYRIEGSFLESDLDLFAPLLTLLMFAAVRQFCAEKNMPGKVEHGIEILGSCAFGIYLVEQPVRILLLPVYLYLCEHSVGVIACSVYVAGTCAVSGVLAYVLKKLPGMKRLV